jgi:hypothetical protein
MDDSKLTSPILRLPDLFAVTLFAICSLNRLQSADSSVHWGIAPKSIFESFPKTRHTQLSQKMSVAQDWIFHHQSWLQHHHENSHSFSTYMDIKEGKKN